MDMTWERLILPGFFEKWPKNTFTFELLYLTNDDEERYSIQAEIAHIILILGMLCIAAEGQELPES